MNLRNDASTIIKDAIKSALPGNKVRELLFQVDLGIGKVIVIAVGKAAHTMAKAAHDVLRSRIHAGLVITKEGTKVDEIPNMKVILAGHPHPNEKSYEAAEESIKLVSDLTPDDHVLFLLSGGASALFEKPMISPESYQYINDQLLACGANINEINTIRKHLSYVKGGRFAEIAAPAKVDTILLSDVLGNDISMVGSGPTTPDKTTGEEAFAIIEKYHIRIPADTIEVLMKETPKVLKNVSYEVVGDISMMLRTAKSTCEMLGYDTVLLNDNLTCEASEAGTFIAGIAKTFSGSKDNIAFLMGGETVVHLKGAGMGGRNQEMALSCAIGIDGMENVCFFSVGSDGTDGPTNAAGGIVDGTTAKKIRKAGIDPVKALQDNDSYHALKSVGSLVVTGATGTNVNDLSVLLIHRKDEEAVNE